MAIRTPARCAGIAALISSVASMASAAAPAPLPAGCELAARGVAAQPGGDALKPVFPPIQLQVRTPVEPIPFPSGGREYLVYELHLQNFSSDALDIRGIDVFDAGKAGLAPVARFEGAQLAAALNAPGVDGGDDAQRNRLEARQGVVAFLCLAFDDKAAVPGKLRHRVRLGEASAEGPVIGVRRTALPVLGRPVAGKDWSPRNGPHIGSHHRMGLWVSEGHASISRRFAIDWRIVKNGELFSGDARDPKSYYAYGQDVLAVANGTVVRARDGSPDNVPRTAAGFSPALPVTMDTIDGNAVVLRLGNGQYAYYAHLQPGSVRVREGDRVRRGQRLGRIGNSGDSRWPHLHFQLTTTPSLMGSEGMPFVLDRYRMMGADGNWQARSREFPWGDDVAIDFGD
ncbi:MAG TPA: M23 family metallopeptidase [Telluria sp.]|nr:M23 family metallopeptidase [Telluria sp.]